MPPRIDWAAFAQPPAHVVVRAKAIGRARQAIVVAYPTRPEIRPLALRPPCSLLGAVRLRPSELTDLQALERAVGGRFVLVAYEAGTRRR